MKDAVEETDGTHSRGYTDETREEGLDTINQLKKEVLERFDTIYSQFEEYFRHLDLVKKELADVKEESRKREEEVQILKREMDAEKTEEKRARSHLEYNLKKIDEKVDDVMGEVGYGESLDVSKIPPNILEIVYQSTLDDLVTELWKSLGPGDFEQVITKTLEEVRLMTSGSELFRFDNNRRILTNNLAKSLSEGLISAKQVQTTYNVLLDKLMEYIPYHKAKNFRAMIKIKSQEYTVDKTSFLLERVAQMEKKLNQTNQLVAALSTQLNAKSMKMDTTTKELEKRMYEHYDSALSEIREEVSKLEKEKIGSQEKNEITAALREIQESQEQLRQELNSLRAVTEMKDELYNAKIDTLVEHLGLKEKVDSVSETIASRKRLNELDEESQFVYYAVPDNEKDAITAAAMAKKLSEVMNKDLVKERIKAMAEEGLIFKKKKGRTVRYYRPAGSRPEKEEEKTGEVEKEAEIDANKEESHSVPKPTGEIEKKADKKREKKATRKKKADSRKEKAEKRENKIPRKEDKKPKSEAIKDENEAPAADEKKTEEKPELKGKEAEKDEKREKEAEEEKESLDREILAKILEILPEENGLTMARIRAEAKDIKYTDILMGIKMLIDQGDVTAVQSGRRTLYRRIKKGEKEDKGD